MQAGEHGLILGKTIADKLGVKIGDPVTLLLPQGGDETGIKNPRRETLTVVGLLEIGGQLDGVLGGALGGRRNPSLIRDLRSGDVVRPS